MTAVEEPKTELEVPEGHVKLVIDGVEVIAPKGELLIRTAERLGTVIPRFCDHPLLDPAGACRECCVLCQRCTRYSAQIAGDPFIELLERGAKQQIGAESTAALSKTVEGKEFQSYFSGNTIQICPVGALTSAAYRFRSRPFDLVSTRGVCEHCASGCALRTDWRRGIVMRRLAGLDPQVNQEWNCDKGRFVFAYASAADRIT